MADIINAKSPLGYIVVCSESNWRHHVVVSHPEMEDHQDAVKNTIIDPDEIYRSEETGDDFEERHVYFSKSSGAEYNNMGFMTRVIVELPDPNIAVGDVVTAFPSKNKGGSVSDDSLLYKRPDKDKL